MFQKYDSVVRVVTLYNSVELCGGTHVKNVGDIKKFYLKRLISILPLYYAWALVNIGQNILIDGSDAVVEELILFPIEALGIQSVYATLFPFSHNGGSWFISCILICYFVYPLIQVLTKSLTDRARLRLILILGAILLFTLSTAFDTPFPKYRVPPSRSS